MKNWRFFLSNVGSWIFWNGENRCPSQIRSCYSFRVASLSQPLVQAEAQSKIPTSRSQALPSPDSVLLWLMGVACNIGGFNRWAAATKSMMESYIWRTCKVSQPTQTANSSWWISFHHMPPIWSMRKYTIDLNDIMRLITSRHHFPKPSVSSWNILHPAIQYYAVKVEHRGTPMLTRFISSHLVSVVLDAHRLAKLQQKWRHQLPTWASRCQQDSLTAETKVAPGSSG